ncbi:unnamed protein product, partial [Heterosigma akashiwo]
TTVWIGLNDESTEGTYVWADGTSVDYTNWNSGEPNDWGDSEDCVEMTSSGGWNDQSCSTTQASVCEIPTVLLEYSYYSDSLSRDDAESACEAAGGMLASITSDEIDEEIILLTGGTTAWIGLNDESTEGTYVWADGTSVDYTNWNSGEPNDWGDSEDCVEITSSGGWNDNSCSTTQGYVCQWTAPTKAPTLAPTTAPTMPFEGCVTGTEIDGACYYYNEDSLSRDDAQTACEALGGMLASIDSSDVDSEVLDLTGGMTVWIGLNDESTEGTYMWADGTSVSYTNWNSGEPNDYGDSEDCVEMTSSGGWNDNSCSNTQASVCEIPTTDLRFRYYTGALSRDDAESACEAAGGMLASITSDEIDEELVELTGGDSAWIGLNDESTEGTYVWADDTSVDYTNWNSGEPNNSGDEDCVEMTSSGGWNDQSCSTTQGYVCQWTAPTMTPTKAPTASSSSCASDFSAEGDLCLKAVAEKLKWSEAQTACEDLGANLAVITTENEELHLTAYLSDFYEANDDVKKNEFWIGLSIDSSTAKWVDGTEFDFNDFRDEGDEEEDGCVIQRDNGKTTYWDSRRCKKKGYYVCSTGKQTVSQTL